MADKETKKGTAPKRPAPQKGKGRPPTGRYILGNCFSLLRRHGGSMVAWSSVAYCIHEIASAFIAYAGKQSIANLTFSFLANISMVWTVSIATTGLAITLYLRERRLHIKTRERLSKEKRQLELILDKNRTSSALTPEGLTRREDE